MASRIGVIIVPCVASVWIAVGGGCRPDLTHQRRIALEAVQQMKSGQIVWYEEKYGEILLSVADEFGDCHIYVLRHPEVSKEQALDSLKRKKSELERRKSEAADPGERK